MQVTEQRGIAPIGGFRGSCEGARISVFPGVAVSNLTPWTLHMMPSTAEAGSRPTAISAGSMQPLLDTWLGADVQQHALLVSLSQSITGCKPSHSISKQQGTAATAATQGPAPSFVDSFASFLEEAAGMERKQRAAPVLLEVPASDTSQRSLPLFQSAGARSRFHLRNELGQVRSMLQCPKTLEQVIGQGFFIGQRMGRFHCNTLKQSLKMWVPCRSPSSPAGCYPRQVGSISFSLLILSRR